MNAVRKFAPENLPVVAKSYIQGSGVKVDNVVKAYLRRTFIIDHVGTTVEFDSTIYWCLDHLFSLSETR